MINQHKDTPSNTHIYWSVDSAPARLTQSISPWVGVTVLMLFTAISSLLLLVINTVPMLVENFPSHDFVLSPYTGTHSVPLRIFIISFYFSYAAIVGATLVRRLHLFWEFASYFVLVCGTFDLINIITFHSFGFVYSLHVVEILSGLFGFYLFAIKLLDYGSMPPRATSAPFSSLFKLRTFIYIGLAAIVAMALAVWVSSLDLRLVGDMRGIALLGGAGPGVFLFLPLFFFLLYVAGTIQAIIRRRGHFSPPVTVIIPAHNEAHILQRTLNAIDAAAECYDGKVHVLLLDNCSTDNTAEAGRAIFAQLENIDGRVVDVPTPGKANALNRGITETSTAHVIRIDADTQILPHTIARAMRHFSRERIGVVGGLPCAPGGGPFDRVRNLETLLKHGYYQVAYGAVDGIVGVPGMFACYLTQAVRDVGGFVGGMNGEDTDMSLRIGEMGYRVIGDPNITYISEVPNTWGHLREQRLRWFRSVFHVSARNRTYLDSWNLSARGKIILPLMLLNSGRRAMTVPLIIFGVLNYSYAFDVNSPLTIQAILAVVLGAPALMAAFAALANGRPGALIGLPEYIVFRIVRSYLTLESLLTIAFEKERTQHSKFATLERSQS